MTDVLLMTPGPVPLSDAVATALASPAQFHHDESFYALLDECRQRLARLLEAEMVAILPGSGRVGLEAALSTTIQPGDRTLHLVSGFFGAWTETMAARLGTRADVLEAPSENGFPVEMAAQAVAHAAEEGRPYRVVTVVHCETSTAQLTDVATLSAALPIPRPLLLVDAISSVPAVPLNMDRDQVDICVLGSQKTLGAPMGLAVVAVGKRALKVWQQRSAPPSTWAYDLSRWEVFDQVTTGRPYPVVPSTHLVSALRTALLELDRETPDERTRRQEAVAARTRKAFAAGGLPAFGHAPSSTVTAVALPVGLDASAVAESTLVHDAVRIIGGMGALRERIIRVPHMGVQSATMRQRRTVAAVSRACARLGAPVDPDAVLGAFDEVPAIPDPPGIQGESLR